MSSQMLVPHAIRIGLICDLLFCIVISTLAICARIYVKLRITKGFLSEDCEQSSLSKKKDMESYVLKQGRFFSRWLCMFGIT